MKAKGLDELMSVLSARFAKNMHRHRGIAWSNLQAKLAGNAAALRTLQEMQSSGGEPERQRRIVSATSRPTGWNGSRCISRLSKSSEPTPREVTPNKRFDAALRKSAPPAASHPYSAGQARRSDTTLRNDKPNDDGLSHGI